MGTVVVRPVVRQDGQQREIHEVVLHVELDDVVVLVVLLAQHPVADGVVLVLSREEEMLDSDAVHLLHASPGLPSAHSLQILSRTHRTADHNVGIVRAGIRVVEKRVIRVRILHHHVLGAVHLLRVNAFLLVEREALRLVAIEKAIVDHAALLVEVLLHRVLSRGIVQRAEEGRIDKLLCVYAD